MRRGGQCPPFFIMDICSLRISPIFQIGLFDSQILVGFGSIGLRYQMEDYANIRNIIIAIHQQDSLFSPNERQNYIISQWLSRGLLFDYDPNLSSRYSRAELYLSMYGNSPKSQRESLSRASICIIGCGGLGSLIATHLVCAGVDGINLIDADIVEESNLSRQFCYREKDIGNYKVDSLKNYLININRKLNIQLSRQYINDQSNYDYSNYSFVVISGDRKNTLDIVNRECIAQGVPFLHSSYVNDIACWGPLVVPKTTGCFGCKDNFAGPVAKDDVPFQNILEEIQRSYISPSISYTSSIAASFAASDIINYLIGNDLIHSLNRRIGLWTNSLKFEFQDFSRSKNCIICGDLQ